MKESGKMASRMDEVRKKERKGFIESFVVNSIIVQ